MLGVGEEKEASSQWDSARLPPAVRQPFNLPAWEGPNEGHSSGADRRGPQAPTVTIWAQRGDRSMHFEHFLELPVSKLYLMESMHSK